MDHVHEDFKNLNVYKPLDPSFAKSYQSTVKRDPTPYVNILTSYDSDDCAIVMMKSKYCKEILSPTIDVQLNGEIWNFIMSD